jgi:dipeptidyl aminopeptidase/acylaminoacyl peptidase
MREHARYAAVSPGVALALGAVIFVLAASTTSSSATGGMADGVSAITLIEQRTLDIGDSQLIALSPDGGSIAVSRPAGPQPTRLCIHDVATLTERACADVSDLGAGLWVDSVVWSPDGKWLAFAELWPQFFVDGDLWLMDASTGGLTNLLDDGYDGDLGATSAGDHLPAGAITLPSYPTFTPDSAAVTFSRSLLEAGEFGGSDVATVPIGGGEAVRLGDLERETPGFDYLGKQWAADGSRLYVSLVAYRESGLGPDSGLWVLEVDDGNSQQLAGLDDWPPRIVRVSPHGEHLLVLDPTSLGLVAPSYALVDGVSGAAEPVETLRPGARQSTPITGVMLSPDGSLLLTVSGRGGKQVAVRDVAGSTETVLVTEPPEAAPSDLAGEVLTWAQNDTVLVNGSRHGRGTLIVLHRGD